MSDGEIYYPIAYGIRLSGMPAFGDPSDHDEQQAVPRPTTRQPSPFSAPVSSSTSPRPDIPKAVVLGRPLPCTPRSRLPPDPAYPGA